MCKKSLSSSSFIYLKQRDSSNCCLGREMAVVMQQVFHLFAGPRWGCHLDSISAVEISHSPLWVAFGAHCQAWRKEWDCTNLHLPFQRIKRMLRENLCDYCWLIYPWGTISALPLSTSLGIGIKSISMRNIPFLHSWNKAGRALLLCQNWTLLGWW